MENLLFFYAVEGDSYLQFILPFLYFAEKYNSGSRFEIAVINQEVPTEIIEGCKKLHSPENIMVYRLNSPADALLSRWLFEPKTKSDYVYIGDIDIMITEPVAPFHLSQMSMNKSCYSNTVRDTKPDRMSGLHFVSREWYAKTETARKKYLTLTKELLHKQVNEAVLKKIVEDSNLPLINELRPIHGVHISLNRKPFAENSPMENELPEEAKDDFYRTIKEVSFDSILDYYPAFRGTLERFVSYVE